MTKKQEQAILAEVEQYRMTSYRNLYAYIEDGEVRLTRYKPSFYTTSEYAHIRYGEIIEIVKPKGGS